MLEDTVKKYGGDVERIRREISAHRRGEERGGAKEDAVARFRDMVVSVVNPGDDEVLSVRLQVRRASSAAEEGTTGEEETAKTALRKATAGLRCSEPFSRRLQRRSQRGSHRLLSSGPGVCVSGGHLRFKHAVQSPVFSPRLPLTLSSLVQSALTYQDLFWIVEETGKDFEGDVRADLAQGRFDRLCWPDRFGVPGKTAEGGGSSGEDAG